MAPDGAEVVGCVLIILSEAAVQNHGGWPQVPA